MTNYLTGRVCLQSNTVMCEEINLPVSVSENVAVRIDSIEIEIDNGYEDETEYKVVLSRREKFGMPSLDDSDVISIIRGVARSRGHFSKKYVLSTEVVSRLYMVMMGSEDKSLAYRMKYHTIQLSKEKIRELMMRGMISGDGEREKWTDEPVEVPGKQESLLKFARDIDEEAGKLANSKLAEVYLDQRSDYEVLKKKYEMEKFSHDLTGKSKEFYEKESFRLFQELEELKGKEANEYRKMWEVLYGMIDFVDLKKYPEDMVKALMLKVRKVFEI